MLKKIAVAVIVWRIFHWIALYLGFLLFPLSVLPFKFEITAHHLETQLPLLTSLWANFDGVHYIGIARDGYFTYMQPFFPLYPLVIKLAVTLLNIPYIISGQFVSIGAFFLSLLIIKKILHIDGLKRLTNLLLLLMLIFPTSFYYASVYNDSLFLLFASATLLTARKKQWLRSSFLGSLATLTRLNGLALFVYIVTEYLISLSEQKLTVKRVIEDKIYAATLIPLAFLGYLGYVNVYHGGWLAVFSSMKIWGQDKIIFPPQIFWRYFKIIFLHPTFQLNYWIAILELSMVLLYIFLIIYSYRKIRLSYWIFFTVSLLIPTFTGTFAGMPRYGLHLFPLFLSLALFIENKNSLFKSAFVSFSILMQFILVTLFLRGYFVA